MPGKLFINYRRDDTLATAGRLHDRFARAFGRGAIFMDVDQIPAGVDFIKYLNQQVQACDVFLVIIGPDWLAPSPDGGSPRLHNPDDFVAIEIAAALSRDIRVIPVLVDGAHMPRADELPEALRSLVRRNAIEVRNPQFGRDSDELVRKVRLALPHNRLVSAKAIGFVLVGLSAVGTAGAATYVVWPSLLAPKLDDDTARRAAVEQERRKAEEAAAAARGAETEAARRRAEDAAAAKRAEEAARRRSEEEAAKRGEADAARRREEEAKRRAEADAARRRSEDEAKRRADAEARQRADDEAKRRAAADAARRRSDDTAKQAEADAARRRSEEEAARRAEAEAARRRAADEEAKRAEAEAQRRRAAEEAAKRADAEAARRRAEEDFLKRAEAIRRQAEEEAARREADEARRKADEEAARRRGEDDAKRTAETAENALRLTDADRRRAQAALTKRGFDTQGSDGVFGPRSRQMIAAWQKTRAEPATGYLTAPQFALLSREADAAAAPREPSKEPSKDPPKEAPKEEAPPPPPPAATPPPPAAPSLELANLRGCWRLTRDSAATQHSVFDRGPLMRGVRRDQVACIDASGKGTFDAEFHFAGYETYPCRQPMTVSVTGGNRVALRLESARCNPTYFTRPAVTLLLTCQRSSDSVFQCREADGSEQELRRRN